MVTVSIITPMSKHVCIVVTVFCLWCFLHQALQKISLSYLPMIVHTTCQNHLSWCVNGLIANVIYMCIKMDECNICRKKFQSHSKKIRCYICSNGYHMKCITLCPDYIQKLTEEMNNWYCPTCLSCLFPYNLITGENDFISAITDISGESHESFCYLSDDLFVPFELNDKDHSSALCDIDPDLHFYQEFNQATVKCNYYLDTKFNDEISETIGTKDVLSLCHVNIRSAKKRLGNFENYLNILKHDYTVIGWSETWLNHNDGDLYGLYGYKVLSHNRVNRAGGGVAVCVQDHAYFKERSDLSYFDEDCETVFIEVEEGQQGQNHNVIIGVIYRRPNQDISSFNDKMNDIVNIVRRENKTCYLLGD